MDYTVLRVSAGTQNPQFRSVYIFVKCYLVRFHHESLTSLFEKFYQYMCTFKKTVQNVTSQCRDSSFMEIRIILNMTSHVEEHKWNAMDKCIFRE
jgi:hypothetical protein